MILIMLWLSMISHMYMSLASSCSERRRQSGAPSCSARSAACPSAPCSAAAGSSVSSFGSSSFRAKGQAVVPRTPAILEPEAVLQAWHQLLKLLFPHGVHGAKPHTSNHYIECTYS